MYTSQGDQSSHQSVRGHGDQGSGLRLPRPGSAADRGSCVGGLWRLRTVVGGVDELAEALEALEHRTLRTFHEVPTRHAAQRRRRRVVPATHARQ